MSALDWNCAEEGLLLEHWAAVDYVLIHILQTVAAHPTQQIPRANVLVDCLRDQLPTHVTSVNVHQRKMTWELSLVLRNQSPFRELFGLWSFNEETTNLVASELEPEHLIGDVQV